MGRTKLEPKLDPEWFTEDGWSEFDEQPEDFNAARDGIRGKGDGPGGGDGGEGDKGKSDSFEEIAQKYVDDQAWNEPIKQMMEAHGLTIEDYNKANNLLYGHNVQSGSTASKKLLDAWRSNTPEGKALHLMSKWNEWQIENTKDYRKEDLNFEEIKKRVSKNWESAKKIQQDADLVETKEEYLNLLDARAAGEKIFYRKGNYNAPVISMTDDERGADTGNGRIKPDSVRTFSQMKDAGFSLVSGARGMVGMTSAREREFIWIK